MTPDFITLRAGDARLVISPNVGASLVSWTLGDVHLLREPTEADLASGNVRRLGGFPLIPFSGRVAFGEFTLHGRTHALIRNFPPEPHAIHGEGWQSVWQVVRRDDATLSLAMAHHGDGPDAWPYAYAATMDVALAEGGIRVALSVTNHDGEAMPAGLGLHPYFPRPAGTVLGFAADAVWQADADNLPAASVPVPPDWRFDPPRAVADPRLDNCFSGWRAPARIAWPHGLAVTIDADPVFDHVIVYVPHGKPYMAVEPATHMPDAINRLDFPGQGLRLLAPGESMAGEVRLGVNRSAPAGG